MDRSDPAWYMRHPYFSMLQSIPVLVYSKSNFIFLSSLLGHSRPHCDGSPPLELHAQFSWTVLNTLQGVPFKDIAGVIGHRLNVPVVGKSHEEATAHFGWFTLFAGMDASASSERTRALPGWAPKQPGIISDIDQPSYFESLRRQPISTQNE
jgi:hypothetical protein